MFLDRDGVLVREMNYLRDPSQLSVLPGVPQALKALRAAGFKLIVVTNQSGVARGYYEEHHVVALHRWMAEQMALIGAHIDAFEYCPDHPEGTVARYRRVSDRRKPAPGMITDLAQRFPVDLTRSMVIGDKDSDMAAAGAANIHSFKFSGGDLDEFIQKVLQSTPKWG